MSDQINLNSFMYEVLLDMEDLERNCADEIHAQGHTPEQVKEFCKLLKSEVTDMDKTVKFEKNITKFCGTLDTLQEEILFYDIVVPFYEVWLETTNDPDEMDNEDDRMEANSLVAASKIIIEILCDYLGFEYFEDEE